MKQNDKLRREILDRLHEKTYFKINCIWCGKHCATVSEEREMIHYDCWLEYKRHQKARQNPTAPAKDTPKDT